MKRTSIALLIFMVASSVAFAQGSDNGATNGPNAKQATLMVKQNDRFGAYLVDGEGRALYTIVNEDSSDGDVAQGSDGNHVKAEVVPCKGPCLQVWPALETSGKVKSGDKIDESKVHVITRSDGARQVTYGGYTLFYFARDNGSGDVNGQDVEGFGGTWYVVSPSGEEIETDSAQ